MRPSALSLEGLSVRYGGVTAISDVTFTVPQGETCGLIGPNGAGKTTLLDCVSGLTRHTAGRVFLNGQEVSRKSAVARARAGLRRTYQRHQLFGRLTVIDNVLAATEWRGGGGGVLADACGLPSRRKLERSRREQAEAAIESCGLSGVRAAYAGALPVGAARMVELARAIVDDPHVLLLDEPTSGLDEVETGRLGEVLTRLKASHDCAVLLVAHDVDFVMRTCDRVVVMSQGEILADGPPEEIRANAAVRSAYLR